MEMKNIRIDEGINEFGWSNDIWQLSNRFLELDFYVGREAKIENGRDYHKISTSSSLQAEHWKTPKKGWFKANVDASFKNGQAALAIVVRDDHGRLC
ncbi:hypothetical protein FNV43_RR12962 [Rhamnella rubrinervis]|uniref:Uncharacterized protein n=1 Tax=Rhamnella rubrinervis TaxID=2594499 RepID=A0A8K0H0A3_9ROSA|nr:hypothetical protein FNV43_RR12962 [Rhamnella rubrinervis]